MVDTGRQVGQATSRRDRGLSTILRPIPLPVRMLFYGLFFLSVTLIGLPWLAYRLDVGLPAWHVEIGWFRLLGVALFAGFLALYVRSSYLLSSRGRGGYVEFDPPREFVAEGPYRWCRNPVAACVVGMLLGEAVALSSTGVFLLFLLSIPVYSAHPLFQTVWIPWDVIIYHQITELQIDPFSSSLCGYQDLSFILKYGFGLYPFL